ncbi:VIT domain-containing protein [Nannocystaceae bacterium ST9]
MTDELDEIALVLPDDDREEPVANLAPDELYCDVRARPSEVRPVADALADPGPGALRFHDPLTQVLLELPLQATRFDTHVIGTIAETEVVQVFSNPLDQPIEAVYMFPLHEHAAVDDYALTIGTRTIRGKIDTREQARATYEQAKQAGQTAGLLEQQRPNLFTQQVTNIAPGETIEVSLHVVQPLDQDEGRYTLTLPTVVGPRYVGDASDAAKITAPITAPIMPEGTTTCAGVEISVAIEAGLRPRSLRSQYHGIVIDRRHENLVEIELAGGPAIANRDFVLSWDVEGGRPEAAIVAQPPKAAGPGYFTMTIAPPDVVLDEDAIGRELVFVVDNSGSMEGAPIITAKAAMQRALAQLRPHDSFAVLRFSEEASGLSDALLPATQANIERGLAYVDAMQGEGGTDMQAGIEAALALPHDPTRVRMVLFLTDGYVGDEAEIFELVERSIGEARLFGLGVGGAPNRYLLDGLAAAGRGAVIYAGVGEAIDPIVERFYDRIATPVLGELEIDWGGLAVSDVLPAKLPDLFAGQPLTVFGRYTGEPQGTIRVRAKTKSGAIELPVEFDLAQAQSSTGVSSIWARHEVDRLLGYPTPAYPNGIGGEQAKQDVIALALEHRLLTQFTSFVAVDERQVLGADGTPQTIVQPLEPPIGTTFEGFGELMLTGTGRGGGGTGQGVIGLGNTGLIGRGGGGTGGSYGRGSGAGFGGRGSVVPQIRLGKASVAGSLDKDVIRRIVRAHINEIRGCYNQGLAKDPTLAGRIVLKVEVGGDGKVVAAEIGEDGLEQGVGACMVKAAKKWTFPKASGGFSFTYPFEFSPS